MQSCKTCCFWKDKADKGPIDWGECHLRAPGPVPRGQHQEAIWPFVKATEGCGEGIDRTWGPRLFPAAKAPDPILTKAVRELEMSLLETKTHAIAFVERVHRWMQLPWYKRLLARF